jgi:hypothetical protein
MTGNASVLGLAYYAGNPTNVSTAIINFPKGTLVLDTTNAVLYQKTSALGDNTGFSLIATASSATLTAPVIAGGLTASGSAANDFSGSTGTFKTSSGANTLEGAVTALSSVLSSSPSAGIGYATGAGAAATQATNKSTTVTNTASAPSTTGTITMNNASLGAATIVSFTFTNSAIAATDVLVLNHLSGGTIGSYTLNAQAAAGSATINVRNNTAGSLSEAIVISYAVIKGATS